MPRGASERPEARGVTAAAWVALFVQGAYIGGLGPVLPDLAERHDISLSAAGGFWTALFLSALLANIGGGFAIDRWGRRVPLAIALTLNATALLLLPAAASLPVLLALGVLLGLGDGVMVVAVHVVVAEQHRPREAAALNLLNVFFGIGAVSGPLLAAAVESAGSAPVLAFVVLGVFQAGAALLIGMSRLSRPAHDPGSTERGDGHPLRSPLLWLLAAGLLVYVGMEAGLGGWSAAIGVEHGGLSAQHGALLTAGYWGALTAARLVVTLLTRWLRPEVILAAAPALSALSVTIVVVSPQSAPLLVAGLVGAGLGYGPYWPLTFAIATSALRGAAGQSAGVLVTLSSLGGLTIPWLQGVTLEHLGPRAALALTAAGTAILTAIAVAAALMVSANRDKGREDPQR